MSDHHAISLADYETQPIGDRARKWSLTLLGVGGVSLIAGFAAAMAMGGWERFGFSYLAGFAFALSIGLGCLLLVLTTHLFRAGWIVVLRRVIECHAAGVSFLAVLFIPILLYVFLGHGSPYPWTGTFDDAHHGGHAEVPIHLVADAHADSSTHAEDHGRAVNLTYGDYGDAVKAKVHDMPHFVHQKSAFLNKGMFTLMWVVFFVVWSLLGVGYLRASVKQDATGDITLTNRREWWAPVGTLLYALTLTFAAFTLLMSLDPTWYSTMYGVYYFAGCMTGALAMLILVLQFLKRAGVLTSVSVEHMHDLGKLLLAFVVFWAYIAYSQYMLVWYAAIPAEQPWMVVRGMSTAHPNTFSWFAVFMLVGHFLLPFCFLMSRHTKRHPVTLAIGAGWMLLMQACDIFWLVLPEWGPSQASFPIPVPEALCMIGATAVLLGGAAHFAAKAAPAPHGDPRLTDSLNFRNY